MCGRFTLYHDDLDLSRLLGVDGLVPAPRYNVAPTSEVAWVRQRADGTREMLRGRWGLVPHWVDDPERFRATLFNARSETAGEKPSFRDALRRARCAVPVSGFYEWRRQGERKQPFHVVRADGAPLLLAGLYAERRGLNSVAVLTCAPNALMATLHDRMPVVLDPADLERWLDPTLTQPEAVADLMVACPDEWLSAYPVDPRVGNARIDESALVQAVTV
jgi:putative SOS response-associated peptidase YedK